MNREEAIKWLKAIEKKYIHGGDEEYDNLRKIALHMAIESLEQPERKKGKWKGYNADNQNWLRTDGSPAFLICSECGQVVVNNFSAHWNYCSNCGCKMKMGVEE